MTNISSDRDRSEEPTCAYVGSRGCVDPSHNPTPEPQADVMVSPQCAKCGDTRGGQPGHETSECRWSPEPQADSKLGLMAEEDINAAVAAAVDELCGPEAQVPPAPEAPTKGGEGR